MAESTPQAPITSPPSTTVTGGRAAELGLGLVELDGLGEGDVLGEAAASSFWPATGMVNAATTVATATKSRTSQTMRSARLRRHGLRGPPRSAELPWSADRRQ